MNFMSEGSPKILKTSTRKPLSAYELNFMSNGAPAMMHARTRRCPVGQTMGPKRTCIKKKCPAGKMINPMTGMCVKKPVAAPKKKCPAGKMINPLTGRCIKKPVAAPKKCPVGKMINPLTGRCIKKTCPEGMKLSAKGRCVAGPGSRKTYALNFMVNGRPLRI